jgi:hypothetical protein
MTITQISVATGPSGQIIYGIGDDGFPYTWTGGDWVVCP